jgi:hypothetical protein
MTLFPGSPRSVNQLSAYEVAKRWLIRLAERIMLSRIDDCIRDQDYESLNVNGASTSIGIDAVKGTDHSDQPLNSELRTVIKFRNLRLTQGPVIPEWRFPEVLNPPSLQATV